MAHASIKPSKKAITISYNGENIIDIGIELSYADNVQPRQFIKKLKNLKTVKENTKNTINPRPALFSPIVVEEERLLTKIVHREKPTIGKNAFPEEYTFEFDYNNGAPFWEIFINGKILKITHQPGFLPTINDITHEVKGFAYDIEEEKGVDADRPIIDVVTNTKYGKIKYYLPDDYIFISQKGTIIIRQYNTTHVYGKPDTDLFKTKYTTIYNKRKIYYQPELITGQTALFAEINDNNIILYGIPTPEGLFTVRIPFQRLKKIQSLITMLKFLQHILFILHE